MFIRDMTTSRKAPELEGRILRGINLKETFIFSTRNNSVADKSRWRDIQNSIEFKAIADIQRSTPFRFFHNKPGGGGIWMSPLVGGTTEWKHFSANVLNDKFDRGWEVNLHDDARILILHDMGAYMILEERYAFNFEEMAKDFDGIYLNSVGIDGLGSSISSIFAEMSENPYRPHSLVMMSGWDVPSLLLLNPKFDFGKEHKLK